MSNSIVRIPSLCYFSLSERGGDKLAAVYATLRHFKNGGIKYYAYTAKNNKFVGGYSLLRSKTNLSLSTLHKHVPVLIDMGLCSFHGNGDFVMLGGNKLKELYSSYKLVPILIGENLSKTQSYCIKIKLMSKERQQQKQIEKKKYQSELLKQLTNPTNYKLYKSAKRFVKKNGMEKITYTDKTILSNQGFAVIIDGTLDNKSKGQYWKSKLIKHGIISSSRRYVLGAKMTHTQYLQLKKFNSKNNLVYVKGRVATELVAEFSVIKETVITALTETIINNKEVIKPLGYLSFDFVAWMSNK
jgi:hypothetical protein